MKIILKNSDELPIEISNMFRSIENEIDDLKSEFLSFQISNIARGFFNLKQNTNMDLLNLEEHCQLLCFSMKYEHLPVFEDIEIERDISNKYRIVNLDSIKHIINEYRPIVFNEREPIYYKKIHNFCRRKLLNKDPSSGLAISIYSHDRDLTDTYVKMIDGRHKSINKLIEKSDFDYLYNGILQHSDFRHTERYISDYTSGNINYVFIKNAILISLVKEFLRFHYYLINELEYPQMGFL